MHSYSQCCKVLFIHINILFLKGIRTFIQQECIKLIKSESNTFIMSQNMTYIKQHSCFKNNNKMIIIGNVSWAANHHIRMISEGSCDTEDWSNGIWKFSFAIIGIKYI